MLVSTGFFMRGFFVVLILYSEVAITRMNMQNLSWVGHYKITLVLIHIGTHVRRFGVCGNLSVAEIPAGFPANRTR